MPAPSRHLPPILLLALLAAARPAPAAVPTEEYGVPGTLRADLPALKEHGVVRALVSYNRTHYFIGDDGRQHGFEHELLREYEKHLNKTLPRKGRPWSVIFVPVPFNELLPALREGRGDIAAAGLTVTAARAEAVAFSRPYLPNVTEIVVASRGAEPLETLEDLAGKRVYVLATSSYARHLQQLNRGLREKGLAPVEIQEADPFLQTEDILEMVNAGIVDYTVADDHLAGLWRQVLHDLVLYPDLAINEGGRIAWALRKDSPALRESVDAFLRKARKGTLLGNIAFRRYFENTRWIKNPGAEAERRRLEALRGLFEKYGERYGFDWLMLAAQAFQESGLDHSVVSPAGAIGIMQVLPSTAADPNVGVPDVEQLESNIHAGTKYLHFLRERYFSDPALAPVEQVHFAHAAYNAGPARVQRMRRLAARKGYDPNVWFRNVELAALELVGREPVRYVANIHKYYIAYRLSLETLREREAAREKLAR